MRIENNIVYFYGSSEPFSNWYKCDFKMENMLFNCSEQALMYFKALHFRDTEIAKKILKIKNPRKQKELGRQISNYDDKEWSAIRQNIMTEILKHKFNSEKLKHLKEKYKGYEFVEASPYDKIWGVGLDEKNDKILDKKNWIGQNLLGQSITNCFKEE